jgi:ABC-type branched-subunit amino acid transport system substrate-binding protein
MCLRSHLRKSELAGRILPQRTPIVRIACAAAAALIFAVPLLSQVRHEGDIVIGVSAAIAGQSAGLGTELNRGADAYIRYVNENGGVHGRRIVLKVYDDGYQPAAAVENTVKLIETDKVPVLFNYVGTPTTTEVLPLLKLYSAKNVYLFCPFTGADQLRTPPYSDFVFNLRASYRDEVEGLVRSFLSVGRKRIALFYQVDAYGRSGWEAARRELMAQGLKIVSEATYRRGTGIGSEGSMTEQVNILKAGNPDAVISVGAYAAVAAFIRDARDQGLEVPIANVSFVGSNSLLNLLIRTGKEKGKDYTGNLVNTQVVPSYEDTTVPAVAEYRKMMQRYEPTQQVSAADSGRDSEGLSFVSFEGFLNAKLLVEVLRVADSANGDQIRRAAESLHDFDIGLPEHVTFTATRHQALNRVYFTTVKNGEFEPLASWEVWRR